MANTHVPSFSQLQRALKISEQIEALQVELHKILGGVSSEPTTKRTYTRKALGAEPARPKKRMMSPEAREKIAAAQRARWAKQKN